MDSGKTALVIRGTADQFALAEEFIENVDKAKPEVVVQVSVAEARVDKPRNSPWAIRLGYDRPAGNHFDRRQQFFERDQFRDQHEFDDRHSDASKSRTLEQQ
jgi:hypothetical protein